MNQRHQVKIHLAYWICHRSGVGVCGGIVDNGVFVSQPTFSPVDNVRSSYRSSVLALIHCLGLLAVPCDIEVFSDNECLVECLLDGMLNRWSGNNWLKPNGDQVAYQEDVQRLAKLMANHNVVGTFVDPRTRGGYYSAAKLAARDAAIKLDKNRAEEFMSVGF